MIVTTEARVGGDDGMDRPIRVVWADDAVLVRRGLVSIVSQAGLEVVAQADDAPSALEAVRIHDPDVAILDVCMPPTLTDEGVRVAVQLREEGFTGGILVVSQAVDAATAQLLLERCGSGVGYLTKTPLTDEREFATVVDRVRRGEVIVAPEVVSRLLERERFDRVLDELTTKELDVLRSAAEGRSNQGIAEELYMGRRTVEGHIKAIFQKLGLEQVPHDHRRVLAVVMFLRSLR